MMLTEYLSWFSDLDAPLRITTIVFVITIVLSLLRKLVKLALLVTLLLIAIFVLRAVVTP